MIPPPSTTSSSSSYNSTYMPCNETLWSVDNTLISMVSQRHSHTTLVSRWMQVDIIVEEIYILWRWTEKSASYLERAQSQLHDVKVKSKLVVSSITDIRSPSLHHHKYRKLGLSQLRRQPEPAKSPQLNYCSSSSTDDTTQQNTALSDYEKRVKQPTSQPTNQVGIWLGEWASFDWIFNQILWVSRTTTQQRLRPRRNTQGDRWIWFVVIVTRTEEMVIPMVMVIKTASVAI